MTDRIKTIMLVEDDADDRLIFTDALQQLDSTIPVRHAHNGKELCDFLDHPESVPADLIFLDLNMPLVSGYECLEHIRKHHTEKNFTLIILTTNYDPENIKRVYDLGASYYCVKPTSFSGLVALLDKILNMVIMDLRAPISLDNFVIEANEDGL